MADGGHFQWSDVTQRQYWCLHAVKFSSYHLETKRDGRTDAHTDAHTDPISISPVLSLRHGGK